MKNINLLKIALVALLVIAVNFVKAQESKKVDVKNFNSIAIASGMDLYLTQGSTESLTIKAKDDLLKNVIVEEKDGGISIKYKDGVSWGRLFKNESIKVYVSYKTLNRLVASGGSDVFSENTLKTDALNITASGGSDIKLSLTCKDLTVTTSGGSDIDLKGNGENMRLTASGGSDFNAFGYAVDYAKATVSGGSDANLFVNKGLEVTASGGSDVKYKGAGTLKKTNSSKSSDVYHVN